MEKIQSLQSDFRTNGHSHKTITKNLDNGLMLSQKLTQNGPYA